MPIDYTFGNTGTIWTGVPEKLAAEFIWQRDETHYVGGTAVGLHVGPSGPTLIVWGWNPQFFNRFTLDTWTRVFLASFSTDGRPEEKDFGSVRFTPMSQTDTWATPVASCDLPDGNIALLLQLRATDYTRFDPPAFLVSIARRNPPNSGEPFSKTEIPLRYLDPGGWLFAPDDSPTGGNVRMAAFTMEYSSSFFGSLSFTFLAIVSTNRDRVRVSVLSGYDTLFSGQGLTPTLVQDFTLNTLGDTPLPGLMRLDVGAVRAYGTPLSRGLSIAFTAHLNHPGAGAVTQGAIFRLSVNGQRDVSFGFNGVWVTPLTNQFRQFICAGEFDGGIVGTQNNEAIAFGVPYNGTGLDFLFGVDGDGIFRKPLGRQVIGTPVITDDGQMTYLFALRSEDASTIGCRFNRQGIIDNQFGTAGLVVLPSDGMPLTPAAAQASAGRVAIAVTRQVKGYDCDRIPGVTILNAADGSPDPNFGAGGFALHAAIGDPAVICPDGSTYYTERTDRFPAPRTLNLRRADAEGRFERVVTLTAPGVANAEIYSLWAMDDGSVLVGGRGEPGWLMKLTPAGEPDLTFGVQGITIPRPGIAGSVEILGVRQDGRISIQFIESQAGGVPRIGLLNPDGSVDTTYAVADNGFIRVEVNSPLILGGQSNATGIKPFLDKDSSVLVVMYQERISGGPYIRFGLRRITPDGIYDPNFGMGNNFNPQRGNITLISPEGSTNQFIYSAVSPQGTGWMDGKLYVVATGIAGGFLQRNNTLSPSTNVLIVTRWNADGTIDTTFASQGVQEAGFSPDQVGSSGRGVLPRSSTELIVFGEAGYTENLLHPPQPAIFKISHPDGIDRTFGQNGAEYMRMQEFNALVIAGRLLTPPNATPRVQFVCADYRTNLRATSYEWMTNFGGIGKFTV